MIFGRARRAREAAAAQDADHETQVRYATQSLGSAVEDLTVAKITAPIIGVIVVLFYAAAITSGHQVGWMLGDWVHGGRAGGPLWFVLSVTLGCGTLLLVVIIAGIRQALRARDLAYERLAELENDNRP